MTTRWRRRGDVRALRPHTDESLQGRDEHAWPGSLRSLPRRNGWRHVVAVPGVHAINAVFGPIRVGDAFDEGLVDRSVALFVHEIDRLAGIRQKRRTGYPWRLHDTLLPALRAIRARGGRIHAANRTFLAGAASVRHLFHILRTTVRAAGACVGLLPNISPRFSATGSRAGLARTPSMRESKLQTVSQRRDRRRGRSGEAGRGPRCACERSQRHALTQRQILPSTSRTTMINTTRPRPPLGP